MGSAISCISSYLSALFLVCSPQLFSIDGLTQLSHDRITFVLSSCDSYGVIIMSFSIPIILTDVPVHSH